MCFPPTIGVWWPWLRLVWAPSSSLPPPLRRNFAGRPRHVDIPRLIAAGQLHETAGGGAVVEEHDRAETRRRLHLARAGERDLQRLRNRAVAPVRRLPGV